MKQKLIKIPDYVFKLPVHEALIEMLNIARESTGDKMIPVEKKGEK